VIPSQAASGTLRPKAAPAPVVLATGLHNPRAVRVESDGSILVAEAGSGPDTPCTTPGSQCLALNGSIFQLKGRTQRRVVTGLPSLLIVRADGSSVVGGAIEAASGPNGTYRVVYGLSGTPTTRAALGAGSGPLGTLSIANGKVLGDLAQHEVLNDPDSVNGNNEVFSNPWNFAKDGDDFLVTDAGANDLIRVRPDGTTETAAVFPNNVLPPASGTAVPATPTGQAQAVPTGIVRGWDGAFYISDMSGINPGLGRIWRYVPGSAPTVFATGLMGAIDLGVAPNGDLIVLSYTSGATPTGLLPGALIRIDKRTGASSPIDTGNVLKEPTGLAVSSNGDIYVSNNSTTTNGQLLKFPAAS
jgi:hypothetical protein